MMLEGLGCEAVLARDGSEAVDRFREYPERFDAVLLDVTMPKLNGNETCAVLRRIRPDVPVIFCSGYADDAVAVSNGHEAFTGFLHKPYRRDDLSAVLSQAFAAAREEESGRLDTAEAG